MAFNDLCGSLSALTQLSDAKTRSVCPENPTGGKGMGGRATTGTGSSCARDLGIGWKISPSILVEHGETALLADISGSGVINHFWITQNSKSVRDLILRIYWDGMETPSVECPLGDFFANPLGQKDTLIGSLAVCVNPANGYNCYFQMPFRTGARFTIENQNNDRAVIYYQIDYTECEIPENCAYFHAQFRRVNPLPYKENYVILDGVKGKGQYVGTHILWGVNNNGWWGEGEIKFYIDGDTDFPTICGTGTEDYFCGAYNFDAGGYKAFSSPYTGFRHIVNDSNYQSQSRFSMYRWHICDPIRFDKDLRVTIQALGWRSGGRYLPLQDDISSVAYWYQTLPAAPFPPLPDRDYREII